MHIFWKGQSCFHIISSSGKEEKISIVIDPYGDSLGLRVPNLEAQILLLTHDHFDHNNKKAVKGNPFVVSGPGEYEIKNVFIKGVDSWHDDVQGQKRGHNTIYTLETENITLCHMGDFGQKELTEEQLDAIGEVDILMVPVGGVYTIDAKGAAAVISQIEPKIIIPMHYQLEKLKVKLDGLDKFLRAMGRKSIEPQPKLLVKKKDLEEEETKIIVLSHG